MPDFQEDKKRVLVVDDEPSVRDSLKLLLKSNFEVSTAQDGVKALEAVDEFHPDLILLDILMPEMDGMETLKALREKGSNVPVIMLTALSTVRTAVQAMKWGAADYLNKPFDVEELTGRIVQTLDQASRRAGDVLCGSAKPTVMPPADFGPMVGKSPLMLEIFQKVEQIATHDATVLITGESGTGKELIAKQIHERSRRKSGPFIAINCAAIPETLIESELFGHEKGAFTHAFERRIGHFELADGGTLFLDEIGELSLPVQVKMLRFLQEHEFYRVGRSKPIRVDVRVMTATNKNLDQLIKANKFRQDLFYRVNVINLYVPPLRDRFEDIPHLVEYFIAKLAPQYGERKLCFSEDAMHALVEYSWPGNVRELENVVESLMALSPSDNVTLEDLPRKVRCHEGSSSLKMGNVEAGLNFEEAERAFETEIIVKALKKTNYVQTRAAEILGISRRILKYKMDKLGILDHPSEQPIKPVPPDETKGLSE